VLVEWITYNVLGSHEEAGAGFRFKGSLEGSSRCYEEKSTTKFGPVFSRLDSIVDSAG